MTDPTIARLRLYPIKGLDGIDVDTAAITDGGTLAGDRRYAMFDGEDWINAKTSDAIHRLRASYPDPPHIVVLDDGSRTEQFDLREDRASAAAFCRSHLRSDGEYEGAVEFRDRETGYVDRPSAGPSVISTATLEKVAGWFDDLSAHDLRRRLRANIEVEGVPAFWEDQFVGDGPNAFTVDGVRIEGVEACIRCVVPQRDPDTGERNSEFRERFLQGRNETLPDWVDEDDLGSPYSLMLIAQVAEQDRGRTLSVGDSVTAGATPSGS